MNRSKLYRWLDKNAELCVMGLAIIVIVIIMTIQVIMRRLLSNSLSWSEELARYLFIYIGFFSISYTIRNNTAIKIDILNSLPKTLKKIILILMYVIMLLYFIYFIYIAYGTLIDMTQTSPTLKISMRWVYLSPLIGFMLTIVRIVQNIFDIFTKDNNKNMIEGI